MPVQTTNAEQEGQKASGQARDRPTPDTHRLGDIINPLCSIGLVDGRCRPKAIISRPFSPYP